MAGMPVSSGRRAAAFSRHSPGESYLPAQPAQERLAPLEPETGTDRGPDREAKEKTTMITSKMTRFAAVAVLSFGLVAAGASESRAGQDNLLIGSLLGGAAGAGAGYAFGKGKGAALGGILGLAAGALLSSQITGNGLFADEPPAYNGYVPPPPPAYQAPVTYQPAAADPSVYQTTAYTQPGYSRAYCRQYSGAIRIDGQRQESTGTACLQPDGTWKIVN